MTIEDAKTVAAKFFEHPVFLEKVAGTCFVKHALSNEVMGHGGSWEAALRYAARPILEARQKADAEKRKIEEQRVEEQRVLFTKFIDFLFEKNKQEFEAWEAARGKPAEVPAASATPTGEPG